APDVADRRARRLLTEADHARPVAGHAPRAGRSDVAGESETADPRRHTRIDLVDRAFGLACLRIEGRVGDARAVGGDVTRAARALISGGDAPDRHVAGLLRPVPVL
ncbi:MAG: hypothetical protein ACK56F_01360, partial [bacterium]